MKKSLKRCISILLLCAMVFSSSSFTTLAYTGETDMTNMPAANKENDAAASSVGQSDTDVKSVDSTEAESTSVERFANWQDEKIIVTLQNDVTVIFEDGTEMSVEEFQNQGGELLEGEVTITRDELKAQNEAEKKAAEDAAKGETAEQPSAEDIAAATEGDVQAIGEDESAVQATEKNLEETASSVTATIKINGTEVKPGQPVNVKYGDVAVVLGWAFSNDTVIVKGDSFTYQLPVKINFTNDSGELKNGGTTVGTYKIENSMITLTYTSEKFCQESDRSGTLTFSGQLTKDATGGNNGGDASFEFPGVGSFPVTVDRENGNDGIRIAKSDASKVEGAGNEMKRSFILTVTATGEQNNVVITDTMGQYLQLDTSSVKFYSDADCSQQVTDGITQTSVSASGFEYKVAKMTDGQKLYVKYTVTLDKNAYKGSSDDDRRNTVKVTSTEDPNGGSDNKVVPVNKTWGYKDGAYDEQNNVINWSIFVNNNGDYLDISGTKVKDTLGDNQTFVEGSFKVQECAYPYERDQFVDSAIDMTWEKLSSADGYTFPNGSDKKYKITYQTRPTTSSDISKIEIKNTATVTPLGDGSPQDYDKTVGVGKDWTYITKSTVTSDNKSKEVEWKITVNVPKGGLNNLKVEDQLWDASGNDITYKEGSFVLDAAETTSAGIKNPPVISTDNEGRYNNGSDHSQNIWFDFGNAGEGKIVFTIKTVMNNEPVATTTYHNNADVYVDGTNKGHSYSEYTYNVDQYLSKGYEWGGPGWEQGVLNWVLFLNKLPETAENVTITDTIRVTQGQATVTYVDGSATAYEGGTQLSYPVAVAVNGATLTFTLSPELVAYAKTHEVKIKYQYQAAADNTNYNEFKNNAHITIDGKDGENKEATSNWTKQNVLDKSAEYTGKTAPDVKYTIKVNPQALDLVKDSDMLTLSDTLGSALAFQIGSLKLDGETVTSDKYDFDAGKRTLTMQVSDNAVHTVTYTARVELAAGDSFTEHNGLNSCKLSGVSASGNETSNELTGVVKSSSGTSTSSGVSIVIYKHAEDVYGDALGDAKFEIYSYKFDKTKNQLDAGTKKGEYITSNKSDESQTDLENKGYKTADGLLKDTVYKVVETEAPGGYNLNKTPQYVVFPGQDKIDWANITVKDAKGNDIELTVVDGNKTTITCSFANKKIPVEKEVVISKEDINGKEIAGAELKITKKDDTSFEAITWTSEEG
ncbi:collagen binding domain-containing protein, partial [Hespellia stercorisuis]